MTTKFTILALLLLSIYLLPTVVAAARKHKNSNSIFIINLFLGWSLIGWVVPLAWAFSSNVEPKKEPQSAYSKELYKA